MMFSIIVPGIHEPYGYESDGDLYEFLRRRFVCLSRIYQPWMQLWDQYPAKNIILTLYNLNSHPIL